MKSSSASIREIRLERGERAAWITCLPESIPAPGRYVMAWAPDDLDAPLGTPLFAQEMAEDGFLAVSRLPRSWEPGTQLELRGPLGRGFALPETIRRLALVILGETAGRLLPLARQALAHDAAVSLYTDLSLPPLPSALEISPLNAAPEALDWADFLALDLPLDAVSRVRQVLGLPGEAHSLPCQGQALVLAPMPCGGLAECGACAVPVGRSWKLACQDGPVFDLDALL